MDQPSESRSSIVLSEEALAGIAERLSDRYFELADARPLNPRVAQAADIVAFAFENGLPVADQWLLRRGRRERLVTMREQFLAVIEDAMADAVAASTDTRVVHSFGGFDPGTLTTRLVFVVEAA